jgi:hypothetical protein
MFDLWSGKTVWGLKLAIIFDTCAGLKLLEGEASQYV